jgi:hypothetical protein
MLCGAPKPKEVFSALSDFIGDIPVVAHNATFDHGIYKAELHRAGIRREPASFLCTKLIAHRVVPGLGSYALGALASHLNVRFSSAAHRAMADAEVCAQILHALCLRIASHGFDTVEVALLHRLIRFTPLSGATLFLKKLAKGQMHRGSESHTPTRASPTPSVPNNAAPETRPIRDEVAFHTPQGASQASLDGRCALPAGWTYYRPQFTASEGAAPSDTGHSRQTHERAVPWFLEPDQVLKLRVRAQARAERADWIYLNSHRCLIDAATGETYQVYGWPQESSGVVIFTVKERLPVLVDRLKLLRA